MTRHAYLFALAAIGAPGRAGADNPAVHATPDPAAAQRRGLAVGLELGEPTAITVGWWVGKLGVSAALGTGTLAGLGVSAHADVQLEVVGLAPGLSLDVGLGGRVYHHGYDAMSYDEIPDTHYGVRASAALAYDRDALRFYAEVAPGIDIHRSASCTLASGPYSICPHAQELPLFIQVVVGARWFFDKEQR